MDDKIEEFSRTNTVLEAWFDFIDGVIHDDSASPYDIVYFIEEAREFLDMLERCADIQRASEVLEKKRILDAL